MWGRIFTKTILPCSSHASFPPCRGRWPFSQPGLITTHPPQPTPTAASYGIDQSGSEQGQCRKWVAGRGAGEAAGIRAVTSLSRSRVAPGHVLKSGVQLKHHPQPISSHLDSHGRSLDVGLLRKYCGQRLCWFQYDRKHNHITTLNKNKKKTPITLAWPTETNSDASPTTI